MCLEFLLKRVARLFVLLAVSLGSDAFAAATEQATRLVCSGTVSDKSVHAPKWQLFNDPTYETTGDIITVAIDKSWAFGLVLNQVRLTLCKATLSELHFSTNCKVNPVIYLSEWTSMTGAPGEAEAAMLAKYGDTGLEQETLRINRTNLSVSDEYIRPDSSVLYDEPKKGSKRGSGIAGYQYQYWASVSRYQGQCQVAKLKI